jgi:hypothetical protein
LEHSLSGCLGVSYITSSSFLTVNEMTVSGNDHFNYRE